MDSEWVDGTYTVSGNGVAGNAIAGAGFDFSIIFLGGVAYLPGDANHDHFVDFTDLGILLNHYNQPGNWSLGDFDNSGTIDFTDLGILLNNFNQGVRP